MPMKRLKTYPVSQLQVDAVIKNLSASSRWQAPERRPEVLINGFRKSDIIDI